MVSQSAMQGTVNPTHFHILVNELLDEKNQDNSDGFIQILQTLTFKLTHMYYNWPVS